MSATITFGSDSTPAELRKAILQFEILDLDRLIAGIDDPEIRGLIQEARDLAMDELEDAIFDVRVERMLQQELRNEGPSWPGWEVGAPHPDDGPCPMEATWDRAQRIAEAQELAMADFEEDWTP